jgi:hypothetical protein
VPHVAHRALQSRPINREAEFNPMNLFMIESVMKRHHHIPHNLIESSLIRHAPERDPDIFTVNSQSFRGHVASF